MEDILEEDHYPTHDHHHSQYADNFSLANRIENLDIMIHEDELKDLSAFGHKRGNIHVDDDERMSYQNTHDEAYILNKSDQKYKISNN